MLNIGANVEYQGKMYTIDAYQRTQEPFYHLTGTHPQFWVKRRHLRKHPLSGLTGRPLAEAVAAEPPTYCDAVKRIKQAGLTMQDVKIIVGAAVA